MNLKEEKELVKRAQKDPEVFAKLYDEYYPKIFGYILRRVANLEIAQDITSETFFKVLKNFGSFAGRIFPFLLGFIESPTMRLPITIEKIAI